MAKQFLDSAGLTALWDRIKAGFAPTWKAIDINEVSLTTTADKLVLGLKTTGPNPAGTDTNPVSGTLDIPAVTTSKAGVMTAYDKAKLDNLGSSINGAIKFDGLQVNSKALTLTNKIANFNLEYDSASDSQVWHKKARIKSLKKKLQEPDASADNFKAGVDNVNDMSYRLVWVDSYDKDADNTIAINDKTGTHYDPLISAENIDTSHNEKVGALLWGSHSSETPGHYVVITGPSFIKCYNKLMEVRTMSGYVYEASVCNVQSSDPNKKIQITVNSDGYLCEPTEATDPTVNPTENCNPIPAHNHFLLLISEFIAPIAAKQGGENKLNIK